MYAEIAIESVPLSVYTVVTNEMHVIPSPLSFWCLHLSILLHNPIAGAGQNLHRYYGSTTYQHGNRVLLKLGIRLN